MFMRILIKVSTVAVLLSLSSSVQAQATCKSADEMSNHFGKVLIQMMSADYAAGRAKLGLQQVDSTQITLVSDPAVCAQAGQALDSLSQSWTPASPPRPSSAPALYVFLVGSSYAVVYLPPDNEDDADFIFIFGSTWNYTGTALSQ